MNSQASPKVVIVGSVGHMNHSKHMLIAALSRASYDVVICEPEKLKNQFPSEPIMIRNFRGLDDQVFCQDMQRKSRGEKRRDRAERKLKGWL